MNRVSMYVCSERREGGRKGGGGGEERKGTLSVMIDVTGSNMSLSVEAAAVTTDQAAARRAPPALTCPDGVGM